MKNAIRWCSRNHVAGNFLMLALLLAGFTTWFSLRKEIFPETAVDALTVSIPYPNATPEDVERAREGQSPLLEITWNWDPEDYDGGRNFGHLAYRVENIYEVCERLMDKGVVINRPPRDGYMAFVRSPDGISIELLQAGEAQPPREPWASMENTGSW